MFDEFGCLGLVDLASRMLNMVLFMSNFTISFVNYSMLVGKYHTHVYWSHCHMIFVLIYLCNILFL